MEAGLERCLSPTGVLCTLTHSSSSASIASTKGNAQMSKFLSGFKRFQKTYFSKDSELFTTLRNGQSPKMLLIACCDSRVDPAIISDCDPGDLFVVRNVANLVAPYTPDDNHHGVSAALEYAVKTLAVSSIVIMGHTRCGGIEALMNGIVESKVTEFIGPWMRVAMKAKERVVRHFSDHPPAFQLRACEHASILLSLENLVTYPWIRDRVAAGSLSIHGWYFDFEEGEMLAWNADTHVFEPLVNRRDSVPGLGVGGDEGVE